MEKLFCLLLLLLSSFFIIILTSFVGWESAATVCNRHLPTPNTRLPTLWAQKKEEAFASSAAPATTRSSAEDYPGERQNDGNVLLQLLRGHSTFVSQQHKHKNKKNKNPPASVRSYASHGGCFKARIRESFCATQTGR